MPWKSCDNCFGSGQVSIEQKSFLGLVRKSILIQCPDCAGSGKIFIKPKCSTCDGRGLLGDASQICPACNGTGYHDDFGLIPRADIKPGKKFKRRCPNCQSNSWFEILSDIDRKEKIISWEADESLRQREYYDQVEINCTSCNYKYAVPIDKNYHHPIGSDDDKEPAFNTETTKSINQPNHIEW